jgi:leader peptidase (prepilin peptidase)/N-methyltransferase
MTFFFYFFIFVLGLAAGSFLNSLIYRLEEGLPFPWLRSFCTKCRHILAWHDLIPVLSFLFLRGHCRYCRQKISWQYPLVELFTGIIFLLTSLFVSNVNNYTLFYLLIIDCFLIVIFVYDLKHYIIPDKVVYPAIFLALLYQIVFNFQFPISAANFQLLINNFYPPFLSAVLAAAFFLAIVLFSKGRLMGAGDIKLVFLMGLVLSFPNILVALFLAFILGAIIGIGLVIFGKKNFKSEVPFAPFLISGTFIALFWGDKIIHWYLYLCWNC